MCGLVALGQVLVRLDAGYSDICWVSFYKLEAETTRSCSNLELRDTKDLTVFNVTREFLSLSLVFK